jgi:hypothetical protein
LTGDVQKGRDEGVIVLGSYLYNLPLTSYFN